MKPRVMKKQFLYAFAIVAGLASVANAESNVTIEGSVFDFGFVPQHSKVTHIFWLRSTGTDSLIIDKVVPG